MRILEQLAQPVRILAVCTIVSFHVISTQVEGRAWCRISLDSTDILRAFYQNSVSHLLDIYGYSMNRIFLLIPYLLGFSWFYAVFLLFEAHVVRCNGNGALRDSILKARFASHAQVVDKMIRRMGALDWPDGKTAT